MTDESNANLDVAITRNLAFDNLGRLDLSPGNERVAIAGVPL